MGYIVINGRNRRRLMFPRKKIAYSLYPVSSFPRVIISSARINKRFNQASVHIIYYILNYVMRFRDNGVVIPLIPIWQGIRTDMIEYFCTLIFFCRFKFSIKYTINNNFPYEYNYLSAQSLRLWNVQFNVSCSNDDSKRTNYYTNNCKILKVPNNSCN